MLLYKDIHHGNHFNMSQNSRESLNGEPMDTDSCASLDYSRKSVRICQCYGRPNKSSGIQIWSRIHKILTHSHDFFNGGLDKFINHHGLVEGDQNFDFKSPSWFSKGGGWDGVFGAQCHFQQYFSYFVAVSFIGGRNTKKVHVPGENHRPAASHWQILSHNVVSSTPCHERGLNSQL